MLERQLEMKSEEIRRLKEGMSCYYGLTFMNLLQMKFRKQLAAMFDTEKISVLFKIRQVSFHYLHHSSDSYLSDNYMWE